MISQKADDPHGLEISFFHEGVRYALTLRSELTDAGAQALVFRALDLMKKVGVVMREVIGEGPLTAEEMKNIEIVLEESPQHEEEGTDAGFERFEGVWNAIKKEL